MKKRRRKRKRKMNAKKWLKHEYFCEILHNNIFVLDCFQKVLYTYFVLDPLKTGLVNLLGAECRPRQLSEGRFLQGTKPQCALSVRTVVSCWAFQALTVGSCSRFKYPQPLSIFHYI